MDISHKINQIADFYKLSLRQFGERAGLGRGAIHSYTKSAEGKNPTIPSMTAAVQILTAFPEISRDWFFFDEGPMLKIDLPGNSITERPKDDPDLTAKYLKALEDLNRCHKELIECLKGHPEGLPPLRPAGLGLG